jgi:hypothetical protein
MEKYHCKHAIEAARWIDTDPCREMFTDWFEERGMTFATLGPVVVLPDGMKVSEGEWVGLDLDGDLLIFTDDEFREQHSVCTKTCSVRDCALQCCFSDPHDGLCACARKIAALRTAGVKGAWYIDNAPAGTGSC